MLAIRLQRIGRKKMATYRVVVSESTKDTQASHLEILGSYNPHNKTNGLVLKEDRIKHYLENGARPSDTVSNLLVKVGLIKTDKKKSVFISKKRRTKIDAKNADKIAKEKAKKEAEIAKEAEAKEVPEKVAEEPVEVDTPAENVAEEKV
jgi:small subunit ribosomal protein S16